MGDLISRSDVIKALEECNLDKSLFEKDVFEKINAIPTACDVDIDTIDAGELFGNGWIPCSERLPEKPNHNVLVTYEDRYIGGVYGVCEGQYVHSWGKWDINDYMSEDDFKCIAWCEKPAPYQPKGE